MENFIEAIICDEPRKSLFIDVFGSNTIPVVGFIPSLAALPGFEEPQEVHLLDFSKISPEQLRKLADYTAETFDQERKGLEERLIKHGFPILAKDTYISTNLLFFL